jgi:hypothetical protein
VKETLPIPERLLCQICGDPIPDDSAKRRSNTCRKKECVNALRRFRTAVMSAGKCPHCYHPSTPEEWAEFRQWRQWKANQDDTTLQSFMKATHGLTLRSLARRLMQGLEKAVDRLEERRKVILGQSALLKEGKPDMSTLPEPALDEIIGLDTLTGAWRELLLSAKELLPEKSVDAKAAE